MGDKNDILAEIAKNIPVKDAYDDLLHPLLNETGKSLGNLASIMTSWSDLYSTDVKERLQAYFERKRISREKLMAPPPEIAVPAIMAMSYESKEKIKEIYTNLLGSSMNVDTAAFVHPSYVEIIKQLLPDEARVLNKLPDKGLHEPLINIVVKKKGMAGAFTIHRNCGVLGFEAECEIPENLPIYLDNLLRLSLIEIPESSGLADEWRYDKIIHSKYCQELATSAKADGEVMFENKMVGLTDYGAQFRKICLS